MLEAKNAYSLDYPFICIASCIDRGVHIDTGQNNVMVKKLQLMNADSAFILPDFAIFSQT